MSSTQRAWGPGWKSWATEPRHQPTVKEFAWREQKSRGGADFPLFLLGQKAILCHTSPIFSLGVREAHHKSPTDSHRSNSSSPARHVSCWPNHYGQFSCKTFYRSPSQMLLLKFQGVVSSNGKQLCFKMCKGSASRGVMWGPGHVHGCPMPAVVRCSAWQG